MYKRQPQKDTEAEEADLSTEDLAAAEAALAHETVSYTHLDVYKRQDMHSDQWAP